MPITDLVVKDGALIAATQGRSFWSFDGLAHVRQLSADQALASLHVFAPVPLVQFPGGHDEQEGLGRNPEGDIVVRFFVGGDPESAIEQRVAVTVKDQDGEVVFERSTDDATEAAGEPGDEANAKARESDDDDDDSGAASSGGAAGDDDDDDAKKLEVARGMNAVTVKWREKTPKILDGMVLWSGGRGGAPKLPPGEFEVTVALGDESRTVTARVLPDPRTTASTDELQARFRLASRCRDAVTRAHETIEQIRSLREQMQQVVDRAEGDAKQQLDDQRKAVDAALTAVEEALYQTKAKSNQDVLNFPIRLTDKLLNVMGALNRAEFGPTDGQRDVANQLIEAIDSQLSKVGKAREDGIAAFNAMARELAVPHVK